MASAAFSELLRWRPQPNEPVNAQITRFVKGLIIDGALDTSVPLPTIHALAKSWGTNYFTVQSAFSPLVSQGLLSRRRRLGTFASPGAKRMSSAGIFFGSSILSKRDQPFYHLLLSLLQQKLSSEGIACRVFFDQRPDKELFTLHPEVAAAIASDEIQSLIVPLCDMRHDSWISRLHIPTAMFASSKGDNRIWLNHVQFASLAMERLAAQGCRSVGVITPTQEQEYDEPRKDRNSIIPHFAAAAASHGLRLEKKWILAGKDSSISHQQFGYDSFKKLAAMKDMPDAMVVFPDDTARGVVSGILESGVRVPADLKVVFHKNEGIDLFCPFPATFIVNSPADIADALIKLAVSQFEGQKTKMITLGYKLEKQKSSTRSLNSKKGTKI